MKLDIKYNGKNLIDPTFSFTYDNEEKKLYLGLFFKENKDRKIIIDDLKNSFIDWYAKHTTFIYETKENAYLFNLKENFKLLPKDTLFKHTIVLLDKEGKMIKGEYLCFESLIYGNNNK